MQCCEGAIFIKSVMTHSKPKHISVMPKEVVEYLKVPFGGCVVDGTLGLGGHAYEILKKLGPHGHLIGLDRDLKSLALAGERLKEFVGQCSLVHSDFRQIDKVLIDLKIEKVDGIVMDLGISSFQLDNPERGFSFQQSGPLDMRMDQDSFISAMELVNTLSKDELAKIFEQFGEERFSRRIAGGIVERRQLNPIERTEELAHIILKALPLNYQRGKIHPATRTFQALRIAVNRELESLDIVLDKAVDIIKNGGRLVVISFHSLEDRIVKNKFKYYAQQNKLKPINKKPLEATDEEQQENPRSRSARMRVAEKIV